MAGKASMSHCGGWEDYFLVVIIYIKYNGVNFRLGINHHLGEYDNMVTVHLFDLMGLATNARYSSFWGYPKSMGR